MTDFNFQGVRELLGHSFENNANTAGHAKYFLLKVEI